MSEVKEGYRGWISEPERARSPELDFGVRWRLTPQTDFPLWRVSWIEATGELYTADIMGDRYILLGRHDTRESVEQAMAGWAEAGPKSLSGWFGVSQLVKP